MAPQVAADFLVPADAPVDRFMADVQRATLLERPGDLLGAPLLAQQPRYERHFGESEPRPAATPAAAGHGIAMRFLRAVFVVVVGPIAPQLAADRTAIAPEQLGDLRLRTAAHKLRRNRVSFFLGELVIRHRCNPFLARMRRQLVSPLPTFVQSVLHLPCDSAGPDHAFNRTRWCGPSDWKRKRWKAHLH